MGAGEDGEDDGGLMTNDAAYEILLVEDDRGDAFLVEELLADGGEAFRTGWVRTLAEARGHLPGTAHCVLLDLGLPDATGLAGLREVLRLAPSTAVVVFTGLGDLAQGAEAVAAGAQDYLVKGEADSAALSRSIRYAIERKRAEETSRLLLEAELRREHNARLERGLLPGLLISDPSLSCATRYRPGGGRSLLGGDFYDALELGDGTLRLVIGDVSGHGPDEAALGVNLRIAWRTLVLAGHSPGPVLGILDQLLCRERGDDATFATLADLAVAPDRRSLSLRLAGHPPPLCLPTSAGAPVTALPDAHRGPPLGVVDDADWPGHEIDLGSSWRLLVYTDGLIEGRAGGGPERPGVEGLVAAAGLLQSRSGLDLVDGVLGWAEELNRAPLPDDVALLLLTHAPAQR